MEEKRAHTDKPFRRCNLQASFQDVFCTFTTGLDGDYYPCTAAPSKIYIHAHVMCGMYLLEPVHTKTCCSRRFQKECAWILRLISHLHFWYYLERKSEMRSTGLLNKFNWKCLYLLYVLSIINSGQAWNKTVCLWMTEQVENFLDKTPFL